MNADKANKKQPDKKTWNLFSLARRPGKGHSTKKKNIYIYICILLHRLLWWLWVALLLPFPPGSERALQAKRCCHESNLGGLTPTADHAWAELVQLQGSSPRGLYWCLLAQSCSNPCKPMDWIPPGSSVHGFFQARGLDWVAISYSRGSFQPRDRTCIPVSPALQEDSLPAEPTGKPSEGSARGLIISCCHFEIRNDFWTKGPAISCCHWASQIM